MPSDAATASSLLTACRCLFAPGFNSRVFISLVLLLLVVAFAFVAVVMVVDSKRVERIIPRCGAALPHAVVMRRIYF